MKKCKGCGALLQNENKNIIGYTPKLEADLCQRCFRLKHYDDVTINMQTGIDSNKVLQKIEEMDALVLWVADLFDFEANIIKGMNRHLKGKDIVLVATKRDILPASIGNEKIGHFLLNRLKDNDIYVKGIVICTDLVFNAHHPNNYSIEEVEKAIDYYRNGRDVVIMGMANAGKSTLINGLIDNDVLTTSRHPGTTLDFNPLQKEDYIIYDTPGLTRNDSILTIANDQLLKQMIPNKTIKPKIYQIKDNQSFALGGLVRLDLTGCKNACCVTYFSNELNIHRGKVENADALWNTHLNKDILVPSLDTDFKDMKVFQTKKNKDKLDIVIHGLGWFSVSGKIDYIKVYVNKEVDVTFREAMI